MLTGITVTLKIFVLHLVKQMLYFCLFMLNILMDLYMNAFTVISVSDAPFLFSASSLTWHIFFILFLQWTYMFHCTHWKERHACKTQC